MAKPKAGEAPKKPRQKLDLGASTRAHRISEKAWGSFVEAAAVTLDRVHGVQTAGPRSKACTIGKGVEPDLEVDLVWPHVEEHVRLTNLNITDASELGAYAIAFLAVHAVDGWCVFARADNISGSDWLMRRDEDPPDAQTRLEVGGQSEKTRAALARLLVSKIDQLRRGRSIDPGLAAAVGFKLLRVLVGGA